MQLYRNYLLTFGFQSTSTPQLYFSTPVSQGGLGILPLDEQRDEQRDALVLAHGFQMLHSPDPMIQALAPNQLHQIVTARRHVWLPDEVPAPDALLQ
jgi:hypothetical protein